MEQSLGLVAESAELDFKRELPVNGREFAKDLAAMTVTGGVLAFGIDETQEGVASQITPVPVAGARERLRQIADSLVRPTPYFEIEVLRRESGDTEGVVIVRVPASPLAPHQANDRFPARADTTTRYLIEYEIGALYEQRRRMTETSAGRGPFEGYLDSPGGLKRGVGRGAVGALHFYARPLSDVRHPRSPWLGSVLSEAVVRARGRGDELGFSVEPAAYDWLRDWRPRGALGWQAGQASDEYVTLRDNRLVAATVTHDCRVSVLATLGLEVEGQQGQTCTYETLVAAETLALLTFAGQVFADVGGVGLTAVDVELMGFGGSVPVTLSGARAFHSGQPRVPDETFSESVRVGLADLRDDPRMVARSLLDRFFASFLPEHTDVVGAVA